MLFPAAGATAASATAAKKQARPAAAAKESSPALVEPGKKFVYKQSGGAPQELEVYFPPDWRAAGPAVPGVILFHGGGWSGGDLTQFRRACQYLAARGLVAATAQAPGGEAGGAFSDRAGVP